ncbi:hypothetical protein MLD38_040209 [Melastoma candidum]|uniref:Uncharacterized protein n=1 Tax=Melastoma candidum TaxID=119954 RepID=A0ACB9L4I3_9MYRT|nr:hypothetical protein MLD38_040209 [Melastoma candidum]
MAEEQALGTPANRDRCPKGCLDSQPSMNPAIVKPAPSPAASSSVFSSSSTPEAGGSPSTVAATTSTATNRCISCRKRVGLTGFRCRCGSTYCGVHRYPENHSCDYDYKKAGREQIQRQNPVVVAEKLQKI